MMYNQYSHNPPSRFLDEIPARLLREEYSARGAGYGYGKKTEQRSRRNEWSGDWDSEYNEPEIRTKVDLSSLGRPKLKIKGHDLSSIPGVSRGFTSSAVNALTGSVMQKLFSPGERVRHPKFGFGRVTEVTGAGKDARIRIQFDTAGERELALMIAPIVKVEEEE